MMNKFFILSLFFFLLSFMSWFIPGSFLSADTIIDSVYSDPLLDGYILFSQNAQAFSVNNWMYDMWTGDTHGPIPFPDPNSYARFYISFYLPDIPEGYHIDSIYVRIYQYDSGGYDASTGQYTDFPVWNVAGGDTIKCIMSHINYGNELDIGDWEKGDVGNPYTYQNNIGTITENGIDGYRYLDVTSSVIQDYELNGDKTQYRIAFQIDTDWDNWSDNVSFITSNSQAEWARPQVFIRFTDEINSTNEELLITNCKLRNFPNPFNPTTTISYSLKENAKVSLTIFNIKGQKVKTLVNEVLPSGDHSADWNGRDSNGKQVSSGIYFYKLKAGDYQRVKKMILLR